MIINWNILNFLYSTVFYFFVFAFIQQSYHSRSNSGSSTIIFYAIFCPLYLLYITLYLHGVGFRGFSFHKHPSSSLCFFIFLTFSNSPLSIYSLTTYRTCQEPSISSSCDLFSLFVYVKNTPFFSNKCALRSINVREFFSWVIQARCEPADKLANIAWEKVKWCSIEWWTNWWSCTHFSFLVCLHWNSGKLSSKARV